MHLIKIVKIINNNKNKIELKFEEELHQNHRNKI